MQILRAGALAILAFCVSGCEMMASRARVDPSTMAMYPTKPARSAAATLECPLVRGLGHSKAQAIDLGCFTLPGDKEIAYYLATRGVADRTRLEAALLKQADDVCVQEKGRMTANESITNASLSFASTALSTVSTIVGGEQAKSILSGAAAIASGTQDNVNANFYRNQIVQAIGQAMDTERNAILTALISKRATKIDIYPADEMIRLVNTYHQACSFEHGLQALLKASINQEGLNAVIAERNLRSRAAILQKAIIDTHARRKAASAAGNVAAVTAADQTATQLEDSLREIELKAAAISKETKGANLADPGS
jgi:hypothetical protein